MSPDSPINAAFTLSYIPIPTKQHCTRVNKARGLEVQSRTVLVPIAINELRPKTFPFSSRNLASVSITRKLVIVATTIQRPQITFCHSSMSIRDFCREQPPALWAEGFPVSDHPGATIPALEL